MSDKESYVAAFRAMTAAFLAAEEKILGPGREWQPINDQQRRLLDEIFPVTRGENNAIPEIETEVA